MKTKFKSIVLSMILLGTATVSSQETPNIIDNVSNEVSIELAEIVDITTLEGTFVHYAKQAMEGTKATVSQAVEIVIDQGLIITKQYIIYTSISHLIPILLGLFLIFWVSKRIYSHNGRTKISGALYNDEIEDNDRPAYSTPAPLILFMGRYYKNRINGLINILASSIPLLIGAYLIVINIMVFIKVTFFSKLYLTEIVLKYIQ